MKEIEFCTHAFLPMLFEMFVVEMDVLESDVVLFVFSFLKISSAEGTIDFVVS